MTQSEKAVIDQQEKTEAGASGNDLGAPFSLWAPAKGALTHHQQAGGGTACGSRAPSGGGPAGAVLPCPVYTSRRQRRLVHRTQLRRCTGGLGGHRPPTSRLGISSSVALHRLGAPSGNVFQSPDLTDWHGVFQGAELRKKIAPSLCRR